MKIYCVLTLLTLICCISSSAQVRNPVILVPGDGGSQFEAKLNKPEVVHYFCKQTTNEYFSLWLNLEELTPGVIDCFVDNMRLVYDNKTRTTHNSPGVDIRIPGFGNTTNVEWLDPSHNRFTSYFSPIVEGLLTQGFKRGISLRGAPFDFRKSPNELGDVFDNLTQLVEETYKLNNNSKIVFIGHSMGSPMILYFLNHRTQAWKDKYILSWISLAGVFGGAVKPLRLFTSGDNLNIPVVSPFRVRREQRSMTSTAWLLPSDKFWSEKDVLVVSPYRNYTVKDYKAFFNDIKFPVGYMMYEDTKDLIHSLTPPGVEVHCLHGHDIPTPGTLVFPKKYWPNDPPNVISDDGDGTVNIRSLLGCLRWQGKQKQPVFHKVFDKAEHMQILRNPQVIQYIKYHVKR